MPVNAVTSKVSELKVQPATTNTAVVQVAKDSATSSTQATNQALQANQAAQSRTSDSVVISNKAATKATTNVTNMSASKPKKESSVMSHMVEQYNIQGKLRIKFLDNKNNVIYQIPPEMVAKTEDLLMKSETSVNVKV